jgi:stage III sporulation protein AE
VLNALLAVFAGQLRGSLRLLGELLVLVVFAAVLRQVQGAFEGEAVAAVADAAVFAALGAICLAGFALAVRLAQGAVTDLSSFMIALLPALVGLLAATGAPTTAGLLHPALLAGLEVVGMAVRAAVFPLLLLAAVLDIAGAFAPRFRLTSLAGLMRQAGLGLLGLLLTVFLGVVAVQGLAGAVADGVALRAAKYATKTFVPVVGGLFADAAEVVLSSSFLLRSGVGVVGLVAVALLVAVPVMKMLALWLVYRLSAALAQPVGGEGVAQVLGGVAGTLSLMTLAVGAIGLVCFLSLSVLVGAGGAAFALR